MKTTAIEIVDKGRGPQLSTSRIAVQDLVPYLQQKYTHEQIREIMPVLTVEEIQAVERYVGDHYEAVMEQDRRIRERAEARMLIQRRSHYVRGLPGRGVRGKRGSAVGGIRDGGSAESRSLGVESSLPRSASNRSRQRLRAARSGPAERAV